MHVTLFVKSKLLKFKLETALILYKAKNKQLLQNIQKLFKTKEQI